jgi:arylsulfatase A-like enzyme
LELAGLNQPKARKSAVDGVSLTPLLQKPEIRLDRDALFFHFPHYYETTTPVGAIRAGDWKLLEYFEDSHVELYNLRDDLSETKNLAGTQPEKAKELREHLADWRTTVHAAMPTVNPDFKTKK